jgi:hypothetical protein
LAAIAALPILAYATRLGFYSDDWALHRYFLNASSDEYWDQFAALFTGDPELFHVFGTNPLSYHLVNAAVLAAAVVLFSLVLKRLEISRPLALAIPAVYAVLPHYSTDRVWPAAFQYPLAAACYFLSLYADLSAITPTWHRFFAWKTVAILGLAASLFANEVFAPLFVLNLALVTYAARLRSGVSWQTPLGLARLASLLVPNVVVLAAIAAFKVTIATRDRVTGDFGTHVAWIALGAPAINLGSLGLGLPHAVALSISRINAAMMTASVVLALLVGVGLEAQFRCGHDSMPRRTIWLRLVAAGLVVFMLGYAVFLTSSDILFTSLGVSNRVAIAGAAGVAIIFVGTLGWLSSLLTQEIARQRLFCTLIAVTCAGCLIVTGAVAEDWSDAYRQEQVILADIQAHFPELPRGTRLILDGVCPYIGPAIVFESNWDLSGALALRYGDASLRASVVNPGFRMGSTGVTTELYGWREFYPYEDNLIMYNYTTKQSHRLANASAAAAYARSRDSITASLCPLGYPGYGVTHLPLDAYYQQIENQLLKRPLWRAHTAPDTPPIPDAATLVALPIGTTGFLDSVNNEVVQGPQQAPIAVSAGESIRIDGWAVDETAGGPAGGVFVVVDESLRVWTEYGWERSDVAEVLGEAYRWSGFIAAVPADTLSPGLHTLELWIVTQDQRGYYTPAPQVRAQIQVT